MTSNDAQRAYPNGSEAEREAFDQGQRHVLRIVAQAYRLKQDAQGIAEVMLEQLE